MAEEYMGDDYESTQQNRNSSRGYKVIIIILILLLGGMSVIFYRQNSNIRRQAEAERDTLIANIEQVKVELTSVRGANEEIAANLLSEQGKADSLLRELGKERQLNNSRIRQYEKEIGTLRAIMRHYVQQIDSLGRINQQLANENMEMRRGADAVHQRAAAAEERASELEGKVKKGSIVRARDVSISAINSLDREVTRSSQAKRLRVDFVLDANQLAAVGQRRIYIQLKGADGFVLTTDVSTLFDYQGDKLTATTFRDVDYQGDDLPVGIYYNGTIKKGAYHVDIFMDGNLIGSDDQVLK